VAAGFKTPFAITLARQLRQRTVTCLVSSERGEAFNLSRQRPTRHFQPHAIDVHSIEGPRQQGLFDESGDLSSIGGRAPEKVNDGFHMQFRLSVSGSDHRENHFEPLECLSASIRLQPVYSQLPMRWR
jgi:hypothetical protein